MPFRIKELLIRSWVIGMTVMVVHYLMGFQHVFIGLFLGIINTFLVEYFLDTLNLGSRASLSQGWKLFFKTIKNIVIAISISLIIRLIDYQLLIHGLLEIPIEPFRYILIYQLIYYPFMFFINKLKKLLKRKNEDEYYE